jgi:type IV secretory pathway VirB10-like protein
MGKSDMGRNGESGHQCRALRHPERVDLRVTPCLRRKRDLSAHTAAQRLIHVTWIWRIAMKKNNLLILAIALSTAMSLGACNRDSDQTPPPAADTTTPAEPAPMPAEPAPMPAEPAPAPATATDSGMSFADMDANKDGGITLDELADTEMLHQHFTAADTNGDGKLSEAEVDKHRADMAATPGG